MRSNWIPIIGGVVLLTVSGCGGDGSGDQPPITASSPSNATSATAEGLWSGSFNANRQLFAAVLDDGTYYFFYSAPLNPPVIGGVVQGKGESDAGKFTSSNAKDFGIGTATRDATVSASFEKRQYLNGSFVYLGGIAVSFASAFDTAYDTGPTLASFAGIYQGQAGSSGGVQPATITVSPDGTFTGVEQSGCTFTGKVTLRPRGNVLDQTLTFGGGPCFFGTATFQGIAFRDLATNRLYAAAPNGARTDAAIFFGTKIP